MYDGNNYVMTQTSTTWWIVFLVIAVTITLVLVAIYLYATARACETTIEDAKVRVPAPEVEGALDGHVARAGDDRELAHAGAGAGGPQG